MRILSAISEEEGKALDDFKRRHARCDELVSGFDKSTGDCFIYSYIPSSLGGVVSARCVCGAEWSCSDFGIHETEAYVAKGVDCDEVNVKAIKHLLSAAKRPGVYFGRSGDEAIRNIEILNQGMSLVLYEANRDGAYFKVMERLRVRIVRKAGPDPQNSGDAIGRLIREAGGGWEAFEIWREEFHACLREEFPAIAEECGLA